MHDRRVVVLHRVLEIDFPVAGEVVLAPAHADHVGQAIGLELLREVTEILPQSASCRAESDEDEAVPGLEPDRVESVGALVEVPGLLHARGADQVAIQTIGPAVIRTDDAATIPLAVEHAGAAVPARVCEGANLARAIAGDEHGLYDEMVGRVVPR